MLTIDPEAVCEILLEDEDGEPAGKCSDVSRFVVERSDDQRGAVECCADHLPDAVLGMAGGDTEVPLLVTIRWDKPDPAAERLARVMIP